MATIVVTVSRSSSIFSACAMNSPPTINTVALASLMICAISVGASRQLTATLTALSFPSAKVVSKNSTPFLSRNAPRVSATTPTAASAVANWLDRSSSWPNVTVVPSNSMAGWSGPSRPWVRTMPANDVITASPFCALSSERNVHSGRLPEGGEVVDDGIQHVPEVGDELAAGHQPEVERVEIALDGDVQTLTVDDRRHRVVVQQLAPGGVERLAGAGHVRDHDVDGRVDTRHQSRRQPHRLRKDRRRRELREVSQLRRGDGVEQILGIHHRVVDALDPLKRIGLVGGQRGEDARHPVRPLLRLFTGADRDRDHRGQRPLR